MMRRIIGEFFTYSRMERRGIMVLLGIIIIVILVKMLLPNLQWPGAADFSAYRDEIAIFEESIKRRQGKIPDDPGYAGRSDDQVTGWERDDPGSAEGQVAGASGVVSDDLIKVSRHNGSRKVQSQPLMVNLNASDSLELRKINGIGPVLSRRIVKYRYLVGGFVRKEQLLEVYGISSDNYDHISRQVYIDTAGIRYIDLNTADREILSRHPYLDDYQVRAIISYRELNGKFLRAGQVLEENLLPEETYNRIKDYLKVD